MSTYYRSLTPLQMSDVFGGRLEKYGIREQITKDTTPANRCLVDGSNWLWVGADENGLVSGLDRFGLMNIAGAILAKIEDEFGVDIVSEYQPQFWGFETQEEWDAANEEEVKRNKARTYADVMAYVRGEPNNIEPGTAREGYALTGYELTKADPTLLEPENMELLLEKILEAWFRRSGSTVTLSDEDLEMAQKIADQRARARAGLPIEQDNN